MRQKGGSEINANEDEIETVLDLFLLKKRACTYTVYQTICNGKLNCTLYTQNFEESVLNNTSHSVII